MLTFFESPRQRSLVDTAKEYSTFVHYVPSLDGQYVLTSMRASSDQKYPEIKVITDGTLEPVEDALTIKRLTGGTYLVVACKWPDRVTIASPGILITRSADYYGAYEIIDKELVF